MLKFLLILGLECIGRTVEKEFDVDDEDGNFQARKTYRGVVIKYYSRSKSYRVTFNDGDKETLSENELLDAMLPLETLSDNEPLNATLPLSLPVLGQIPVPLLFVSLSSNSESSCRQPSSSTAEDPPQILSPILQLCSCGCGTESDDMVQCPGAVKILCNNKLTRQCERSWKKCTDCSKKKIVIRHAVIKRSLQAGARARKRLKLTL
jgi:hypothetical protein